jgi:hypothetical protein
VSPIRCFPAAMGVVENDRVAIEGRSDVVRREGVDSDAIDGLVAVLQSERREKLVAKLADVAVLYAFDRVE